VRKYLIILLSLFTLNSCIPSEDHGDNQTSKGSELIKSIDDYLSAITSLGFSGSIIISEGNNKLLQKGYGISNRVSRSEYTPKTIQSCGSITKHFTAAAILLLESQNKLSVNDELSEYFYSVPKKYHNITIHQLLTHSSGIISGIGPDEEKIDKEGYLNKLWQESLEFEPGSGYHYSNAGYSLLGMIIEQVSKMSYEDYLSENLFIPSKMESTGYLKAVKDTSDLAIGYSKGNYWGKVYNNGWLADGPNWHLRANGGIHTTVEDMHKWFQVILGKGVLETELIDKWTTGYVNENNSDSKYAYGLVVYDDEKYGKIISHSGSNRIFAADLVWLPERNILFYIHSNSSIFPAYELRSNILAAAFDSTFQAPPLIEYNNELDPKVIRELEGIYENDGNFVDLKSDDIRLKAKLDGQPMVDYFLRHSLEQQRLFADLNKNTQKALDLLEEGKADALKGLLPTGEDPIAATERLLRQRNQFGDFEYLNLVGTFENSENSRFSKFGRYTTFVHARFPNWNRYWNFVFDKDGKYIGTFSGPWPEFNLIPIEEKKFIAVRQEFPYDTVEIIFKDECMVLKEFKACLKQ